MAKNKKKVPEIKQFPGDDKPVTVEGKPVITMEVETAYMHQEICVRNQESGEYYWCKPVAKKEFVMQEYTIEKTFDNAEKVDKWLKRKFNG